ncbi:unnamed protein product [Protopolystoma xenopodis]|uniref:ShKT domain-containing protein n=1 Tax=Protopolystoma xenopodis TaxID=117903 RepID=A0A448WAH7_9PLAT|nr:unnamed protein product [Protopolystoma xenopodis]
MLSAYAKRRCYDDPTASVFCSRVRANGGCKQDTKMSITLCRKSCGRCFRHGEIGISEPPSLECSDLEAKLCPRYVREGYCYFDRWTKLNCRRSCDLCLGNGTRVIITYDDHIQNFTEPDASYPFAIADESQPILRLSRKNLTASEPQDSLVASRSYKQPINSGKLYLVDYGDSRAILAAYQRGQCLDRADWLICAVFAERGDCLLPGNVYMTSNCARSCGVCKPNGTFTYSG